VTFVLLVEDINRRKPPTQIACPLPDSGHALAATSKSIFGAKIDHAPRLLPNHGVVHDAGVRIDAHALKNVETARHIVRRDLPGFHRAALDFPAAVIGISSAFLGLISTPSANTASTCPQPPIFKRLRCTCLFASRAALRERVLDDRSIGLFLFEIENIPCGCITHSST